MSKDLSIRRSLLNAAQKIRGAPLMAFAGQSHGPGSKQIATLNGFLAAQLLVSFLSRAELWPTTRLLVILRTFMYKDLQVILVFGTASWIADCLCRQRNINRRAVLIPAGLFTVCHVALMSVNVSAVYWLGAPLTFQWLLAADPSLNGTSWLMISTTLTHAQLAGLILSLGLAPALTILARNPRVSPVAGHPPVLLAILGIIGAVLLTAQAPRADRWRDAVGNPFAALVVSYASNLLAEVLQGPGNHDSHEFALQPQVRAPRVEGSTRTAPDLLVVVLESVSNDVIKKHLSNLPTIRRLIETGIHFPNASVSTPTSLRTMFSLMFSRYPLLQPRPESQTLRAGYPEPFLKTLRRAGYETNFILGGDLAFQQSDLMFARGGVGAVEDSGSLRCSNRWDISSEKFQSNIYLPDSCTYSAAERWLLNRRTSPKAVIVWPEATHFPYFLEPSAKQTEPTGSQPAYVAAIRNSDALLGRLLTRLEDAGVRPIVLIIGDHGEQFGEHGFQMHGQTVHQEEIGIPFILSGPGLPSGRTDLRLVNVIDVGPTLLDLAGLSQPEGWQGMSALGPRHRSLDFAFAVLRNSQVSVRTQSTKYIHDLQSGKLGAFDLTTDPLETRPRTVAPAEAAWVRKNFSGWAQYNLSLYQNN